MGERQGGERFVVLSRWWGHPHRETSFVVRALAGALSRLGRTDVLVPGRAAAPRVDGAFDVWTTGRPGSWPDPAVGRHPLFSDADPPTVLVEGDDAAAIEYARCAAPRSALVAVVGPTGVRGERHDTPVPDGALVAVAGDGSVSPGPFGHHEIPFHRVGVHVAVNPLARTARHVGFGFTDYLLVLTDRHGRWPGPVGASRQRGGSLSPLATWIAARFARRNVVVVESAQASAWRSRSLRGVIPIDSRTDLWRLMAHARVTVDLDPGPLVGRECVESLRLGTPIVVRAGSAAAEHAHEGGGLTYGDVPELLWAVNALYDDELRAEMAGQGREVVDRRYGDPVRFVERVQGALTAVGGPAGEHDG